MAKEKLNGWAKVLVSIATTLVLIGAAWATMRHQVDDNTEDVVRVEVDGEKKIEALKVDGCDPSRTINYNLTRVEKHIAGFEARLEEKLAGMERMNEERNRNLEKKIDAIKDENDSDHKDIMEAIKPGSP